MRCESCGYVARTTRKWLADIGAPLCPCNAEPMMPDDHEDAITARNVDQTQHPAQREYARRVDDIAYRQAVHASKGHRVDVDATAIVWTRLQEAGALRRRENQLAAARSGGRCSTPEELRQWRLERARAASGDGTGVVELADDGSPMPF